MLHVSDGNLAVFITLTTLLVVLFALIRLFRLARKPSRVRESRETFAIFSALILSIGLGLYLLVTPLLSGEEEVLSVLGVTVISIFVISMFTYTYAWALSTLIQYQRQLFTGKRRGKDGPGFISFLFALLLIILAAYILLGVLQGGDVSIPTEMT